MVKVVRKTVPSSGSSITETALAELGSAPQLDVGGCVRGSETRTVNSWSVQLSEHSLISTVVHGWYAQSA